MNTIEFIETTGSDQPLEFEMGLASEWQQLQFDRAKSISPAANIEIKTIVTNDWLRGLNVRHHMKIDDGFNQCIAEDFDFTPHYLQFLMNCNYPKPGE